MRDEVPPWQEQALYRALFEQAQDAMVVIGEDGHVYRRNRAARALRGVDLDALLGSEAGDSRAFWAEVRASGRASREVRIDTPEATRHLELEGKAIGRTQLVVIRDISERRARDEELARLREREPLGYLVASVVHDFNNLMAPIVSLSEVLEGSVGAAPRAAEAARDVKRLAVRAAALTKRLVALVRRDPGPPPRQVDVSQAIEGLEGLLRHVVGPGVELDLDLDPAAHAVEVHRDQLEHVVFNLAANARDAMPNGGRLTIHTANVMLDGGPFVAVVVTDTGVGMSPEVRERVFERFFTTKLDGRGTGLGLAGARHFAMQNGGCITVRSDVGRGTTIAVYLPPAGSLAHARRAEEADEAEDAEEPDESPDRASCG